MRNVFGGRWVFVLILGMAVCLMAGQGRAEDKKSRKQMNQGQEAQAEWPCNLDYHVNVVTLGTNSKEMYWKQDDCIRVHVVNNPFIYTYSLKFNEEKIAEDDVLGALGSLVGLKSIKETAPTANAAAKPKPLVPGGVVDSIFTVGPERGVIEVARPKPCDSKQTQQLALQSKRFEQLLEQLKAKISEIEPSLNAYRATPGKLEIELQEKEGKYREFQKEYLVKRTILVDQKTDLESLKQFATDLQAKALEMSIFLTGDTEFENEMVQAINTGSRLQNEDFSQVSKIASDLDFGLSQEPVCAQQKPEVDKRAALETEVREKLDTLSKNIADLTKYASQVANKVCRYKARKNGEFAWVYDQVYQPITAVLASPVAFGVSVVKREGPFPDPTAVQVTLNRDVIIDSSAASIPKADNVVFECAADSSKILQAGKSFSTLEEVPVPKPVARNYTTPSSDESGKQGQVAADKAKPAADKTQEATTVVLEQPWYFGGPRLIVSGGLASAFLRKQEFQRSNNIINGQSQPVIGLKTDSSVRLSPMIFAHTRLWAPRHWSEATYATFGVTANSDTKGTDPEFLFGGSVSFAQQKFFLSAGAYVGKQQKLDGGLHVGDVIPSTLTGELPLTKSYHTGFALSLSYRFASSKDPKKDTPAPAKPSSSPAKKPNG